MLRVYYPEIEALIKRESGAQRVVVFDHTIRTPDDSRHAERWIRQTVKSVHNDYTERSAPKRVRDILPDEANRRLKRRFEIIQVWRSIAPRVESEPLAMCDGRSIPEVGFIRNERRYRNRTAETYHIAYNPAHRWFYFPYMTRNEALVFKVFDSDPSAGVRFTAHSAFDDPTTAPDAKPARASRCVLSPSTDVGRFPAGGTISWTARKRGISTRGFWIFTTATRTTGSTGANSSSARRNTRWAG